MIVCEPGKDDAHKITNISKTEYLIYLEFDTINFPEVIQYPDSQKIGVFIDNENKSFFKQSSNIGYYE